MLRRRRLQGLLAPCVTMVMILMKILIMIMVMITRKKTTTCKKILFLAYQKILPAKKILLAKKLLPAKGTNCLADVLVCHNL